MASSHVTPTRTTLPASRYGVFVRRYWMSLLRVVGAVVVLLFVVRQVGAAPFHHGLRALTWPAFVAAVVLAFVTTACSGWRWRVVARALGVDLALPTAIGAYYRSQFLNSVLPGGVLGDVHRAVAHGKRAGDVGRGVRAVAWERFSGQVVQTVITVVVLLVVPSPVRPALPYALGALVGAVCVLALLVRCCAARRGRSRLVATARAIRADVRRGLLARAVWPQLVLSSVLIVAGHTTTFVIAARVAGCTLPLGELIGLLMVVQTAMVIPLSIGGWGPREGVAAWAFAAAGVGAATGVAVTTVYAVLSLAAVAPGAALLLRDGVRSRARSRGGLPAQVEPPRAGTPRAGTARVEPARVEPSGIETPPRTLEVVRG